MAIFSEAVSSAHCVENCADDRDDNAARPAAVPAAGAAVLRVALKLGGAAVALSEMVDWGLATWRRIVENGEFFLEKLTGKEETALAERLLWLCHVHSVQCDGCGAGTPPSLSVGAAEERTGCATGRPLVICLVN